MSTHSNRKSRPINTSTLAIDDLIKSYFDKKNNSNPEQQQQPELESIKAKLDNILGILDDKNYDETSNINFKKTTVQEKVTMLKSIMNSLFSKYKVGKDLSLSHLFTSRLQRLLLQQSKDYSNSKIDFESFKMQKPQQSEISKEPFKLENNEYTQISNYNSMNNDPSFFEQWLSNKSNPQDTKLNGIKIIFRRIDSLKRIELLKYFYVIKNVQPKKQYCNFVFKKMFFVLNQIVFSHYKSAWSQMNFCNTLTPINIQEMSVEMSYTLEDINNLNFQKKGFQQPIIEESNESMSQIKSTIEFLKNDEELEQIQVVEDVDNKLEEVEEQEYQQIGQLTQIQGNENLSEQNKEEDQKYSEESSEMIKTIEARIGFEFNNFKLQKTKTETDLKNKLPINNNQSNFNRFSTSRGSAKSEERSRYQSYYSSDKTPKPSYKKKTSTPMKKKAINDRIKANLAFNDYQLIEPKNKNNEILDSPGNKNLQHVDFRDFSPIAEPKELGEMVIKRFGKAKKSQEVICTKSENKRVRSKVLSDFTNLEDHRQRFDVHGQTQSNNLAHHFSLQKVKIGKKFQQLSKSSKGNKSQKEIKKSQQKENKKIIY